jgi:hypothetical protein
VVFLYLHEESLAYMAIMSRICLSGFVTAAVGERPGHGSRGVL